MDVITPEFLQQQTLTIQIFVWLGGGIVTGLISALAILWKENRKQAEYIREQDKANLLLLTEISNFSKALGVDVSKVDSLISSSVVPSLNELKILLRSIEKQLEKWNT